MKYITSIWATLAIVVLGIILRVYDPSFLQQLRLTVFDQYITSIEETKSNDIVLLNISEETLGVHGQYPFPRQIYAQMISDLRNAGAGMIGFTIMYPEADRFGGDEVFASWIKDNGIILAQDADPSGRSDSAPYVGSAIFGTGDPLDWLIQYEGLVTNIPTLEAGAWGHGLVNAMPEIDGVARRIPLLSQINGQVYPSFSLETIRVMQNKPSYTIKVNDTGIEEIILRPFQIPTDVNGSVWLNPNIKFTEINYGSSELPNLMGKSVLIGLTASGLASQIPTPSGMKSAHSLQASAIQTIVDGTQITRPLWADILEIVSMIVGSILIVVAVYYLPIWISGTTFLILSSVVVGGFIYIWQSYSILLSPLSTLILYIITFTSAAFNNFYKQFVLRQQIKKQFETYLDPRQVYLLQKNPELLKLGGERREMTFLFMDICGFTPVSEHYKNKNDPEGLVLLINDFLDNMTKIIMNNGGTIDKYMGDCIMAFWNAPLDCPNHADMAVKSALEIEAKTDELRRKYSEQGLPPIKVGTGINTGTCIVGNMGSESRFDYSVIGDAVNLAARLEATAARGEYINCPTIISSFTMEQLTDFKPRPIGDIKVKGKEELIKIYAP
jgi:adenylate cyclase